MQLIQMLVLRLLNFLFDISRVTARYKVRKIAVIADNAKMSCVTYAVLCRFHYNVEIGMPRCLGIIGNISVAAVCTFMFGIAIAHARRGSYRFDIGMPLGFNEIGYFFLTADLASVCGIAALRTSGFGHHFRIGMTESFHIAVLERITAVRTSMQSISLLRTSGRNNFVRVCMSLFVHERIRIFVAASRTEVRHISLVHTRRGNGDVYERMSESGNKIIRVAFAAICTDIDYISLLGTRCRNHFDCFKIMLARLAVFGIRHRQRHCRRNFDFCRRTCFFFRCSATDHRYACDNADYKKRNEFQKFPQLSSPFLFIFLPVSAIQAVSAVLRSDICRAYSVFAVY